MKFFHWYSDEEIPSDTEDEEEELSDEATPQRKKMKIAEYETEIGERNK